MRGRTVLVVVSVLFATSVAWAQTDITGTFEVKYDEVGNNCTASGTGITLGRGTLKVTKKGKVVTVDIQRFPLMTGTQGKGGKLRAISKRGTSPIDGTEAKVSVAGKVEDGLIQLQFVAEYYNGQKPLCSQSWNVSGVRKEAMERSAAPQHAR